MREQLPTFLRWYIDAAGEYTVAPAFHFWSALSLLGTFASKGLYYEHIPGNPLRTNLFVFLIARSAAGKGLAISEAMRLASPLALSGKQVSPHLPYLFEGRTSPSALVSRLAWIGRKLAGEPVEFYMLSPELGASLDLPGALVSGFVKMMTHIYDHTGREWNDNTRTHGAMSVPPAFINWLVGTTPQWLRSSVGEEDFRGGFGGRVVPVYVEDRTAFRYRPTVVPHRATLYAYLRSHLLAVRSLRGPMTMTPDARDADESWARARYEHLPTDERLHPFYERGATLARKLAMLMSVAEGFTRRITVRDLELAQRAVIQVERDLPAVLDLVAETRETRGLELMRVTIERAGRIKRKVIAGFMRRQLGITRTPFNEYEATLRSEGCIEIDTRADEYVWLKRGTTLRASANGANPDDPA